jgi:hypothetical protein
MTESDESKYAERRKNPLLRLLIEEMLVHVRELQREGGGWTDEERTRAEQELARVMSQVRGAAVRPPDA